MTLFLFSHTCATASHVHVCVCTCVQNMSPTSPHPSAGGPKLRKWYGAPDQLPLDRGEKGPEQKENEPVGKEADTPPS